MIELSSQADELREAARNIQGKLGRCLYRRKDVDEMQQISGMLCEAADTIESLRDKLQPVPAELDYIEDKSRWAELFGTPEKAARTLFYDRDGEPFCEGCALLNSCKETIDEDDGLCLLLDYDALLEWLKSKDKVIDEPDVIRNELMDSGLLNSESD